MKRYFLTIILALFIVLSTIGCSLQYSYYRVGRDAFVVNKADSVTFQQALDNLPTEGGTLLVQTGHYHFTELVTRNISHVYIIGIDKDILFTNDNVTPLFKVGGSGWIFINLKFDKGGIDYGTPNDCLIRNVTIGDRP